MEKVEEDWINDTLCPQGYRRYLRTYTVPNGDAISGPEIQNTVNNDAGTHDFGHDVQLGS